MTEEAVFTPEEEADIAEIQRLRRKLIRKMTKAETGEEVEVPVKGQVFLLGLLDGADRSALTRARLRQQKKQNEDMGDAVRMVGEALRTVNTRTYRPAATAAQREIPAEHATRTYVPGELDTGIEPIPIQQVMGQQ